MSVGVVRVGALQTSIAWEDPEANFARLEPSIEQAAARGVRLLALPEMYACGFTMATDHVAEPVDGPSTRFLVEQAARHDLWLAGSVPERSATPGSDGDDTSDGESDTRPHNTLILASPDGTVHRYQKIHPFTYAGEHEHYAAGTDFVTVEVDGLRLTLFVCYDLRFADEFWATAPDTDAYLVVANWPEPRREHWRALLVARAIENQAYVVGVNRVGEGGGLAYTGDSRIVDPMGRVLAEASHQEALLVADLDPTEVARVRRELPFLRDRR